TVQNLSWHVGFSVLLNSERAVVHVHRIPLKGDDGVATVVDGDALVGDRDFCAARALDQNAFARGVADDDAVPVRGLQCDGRREERFRGHQTGDFAFAPIPAHPDGAGDVAILVFDPYARALGWNGE